jgi:hypothetical protein
MAEARRGLGKSGLAGIPFPRAARALVVGANTGARVGTAHLRTQPCAHAGLGSILRQPRRQHSAGERPCGRDQDCAHTNIAAGNRLVVLVGVWSNRAATAKSVTDAAGNSYAEIQHFKASENAEPSVWTAQTTAGDSTKSKITVTGTGKAGIDAAAIEYSGLSTATGRPPSTNWPRSVAPPHLRERELGAIVVLAGVWSGGAATAKSVTDSAGNTYVELLRFKAADHTEMSGALRSLPARAHGRRSPSPRPPRPTWELRSRSTRACPPRPMRPWSTRRPMRAALPP